MEADFNASQADALHAPRLLPSPELRPRPPSRAPSRRLLLLTCLVATLLVPGLDRPARAQAPADIRARGVLRYGSDMEGGGPFAYPDPQAPRGVTGFEVEMMTLVGRELGAPARLSQGQWDQLLAILDSKRIDLVVNGYEWTETRQRDYLATRPYYVYQLQLMGRKGGEVKSWADLSRPKPNGRRWTVGVLVESAGDFFAHEHAGETIRVVRFDGATDAMLAVQNGQLDYTIQDLPAVLFYKDRYPGLELVGPPESRGYYVIYTRKNAPALRDEVDAALGRLIASGELQKIYEKYGIWNEAQEELAAFTGPIARVSGRRDLRGWALIQQYAPRLGQAAAVTLALSFSSMPLAVLLGLLIAAGRLYGPAWIRAPLIGYVELIRGTPLMLQLFVLFYLLRLPPWVAGIAGLAINYSAYEAEIFRAGLQAVPKGQMEAALALGMSKGMALRRVVAPQAIRIVIPPVANDFISLFKDTSVCSVITLVELTKQYSILANSTGGVVEFAAATAVLYLVMSVPLSWFSRWAERQADAGFGKGGAIA